MATHLTLKHAYKYVGIYLIMCIILLGIFQECRTHDNLMELKMCYFR